MRAVSVVWTCQIAGIPIVFVWQTPRPGISEFLSMATVTKKDLIDRIAEKEDCKRVVVKRVIQDFLDSIIDELGKGNRLEFRDFGVFESRVRKSREAQNPKTMDKVFVPSRRTVKFKVGRVMKMRLHGASAKVDEATGLAVEASAKQNRKGKSTMVSAGEDGKP